MTNRERCIALLDAFSEAQLANVAIMLQDALKNLIAETSNEENCKCHRKPGIAQEKFVCPDDIDVDNEMISNMFEQN